MCSSTFSAGNPHAGFVEAGAGNQLARVWRQSSTLLHFCSGKTSPRRTRDRSWTAIATSWLPSTTTFKAPRRSRRGGVFFRGAAPAGGGGGRRGGVLGAGRGGGGGAGPRPRGCVGGGCF